MKKRNEKILKMYKGGKTLREIEEIFKFTSSRAQQIVANEIKKEIIKKFNLIHLTWRENEQLNVAVKEEIRDISSKRKRLQDEKKKKELTEKMQLLPHHSNFSTLSSYAKALGEGAGIVKIHFSDIADEIINQQRKKWSRHYNKCRVCGTISVKHASHGLCEDCYLKSGIFKEIQEASRLRNQHKWKKHRRLYIQEYNKRSDVITRQRRRWDLRNFDGNREKAIKRDNYKCAECGLIRDESYKNLGCDLFVKHTRDSNNNMLGNLITLCKKCFSEKRVPQKNYKDINDSYKRAKGEKISTRENGVDNIMEVVAESYGLTPAKLKKKTRRANIAQPRQIAIYLIHNLMGLPFSSIGEIFRLDHTTAMYACDRILEKKASDDKFREQLEELTKLLKVV